MVINSMTIGEETRKRIFSSDIITKRQITKIRRDGVIKLIKSKESGHLFSSWEVYTAAGFKKNEGDRAWGFLRSMVLSGMIFRNEEMGTSKCSYTINDAYVPAAPGRVKGSKNKNKRIVEKAEKNTVVRKIEELVETKPINEVNSEESVDTKEILKDLFEKKDFSFVLTIRQKNDHVSGSQEIASVSLTGTSIDKIKAAANHIIDSVGK